MYQQTSSFYIPTTAINGYYMNPIQSSYTNNTPIASSDSIYSFNQQTYSTQPSEYYIPTQWMSKQNYSWSNDFCGQSISYNNSPGHTSLTSNDCSNKSIDNSSFDFNFNSNQNGSFNYSYSSVQSSPSSHTCDYQVKNQNYITLHYIKNVSFKI